MYFKDKASNLFPAAQWTGGSSIHASIAWVVPAPVNHIGPRQLLHAIMQSHFGTKVLEAFVVQVPDLEWVLTPAEFENLVNFDFYRLLNGFPLQHAHDRLRNPMTGNLFHRVALLEGQSIVVGVRFWITPSSLGWRFRLEEAKETAVTSRQRGRELVSICESHEVQIKEYVAPVSVSETEQLQLVIH